MAGGMNNLTDREVVLMLNAFQGECGHRNRLLFLFGITTGYRISELLSIKIGDVFKKKQIQQQVTIKKGYMKGGKESRTMELNKQLQSEIMAYLTAMDCFEADHSLFCSDFKRNRPMNRKTANVAIKQAQEIAGIQGRLGTHCMRKTAGHNVYKKSGNNIVIVQKWLGHAYVTSTQDYINPEKNEASKIVADWEFDYEAKPIKKAS